MRTPPRRSVLLGLGSAAAAGLGPQACAPALRSPAGDAVAAGQPAALLIWAVARERLAAWPRKPDAACLAALPAPAAGLPETGALAGGGGRPASPEVIAALKPRLIIDYGDADSEHRGLAARMRTRLGVEWRLIDGALPRIPDAFREAGRLLGAVDRGANLADAAAEVIERWRQAPPGPAFYYARGADGLETGFRGALATEVLEGAGWTNVAEGSRDIGRVTREQVVAWDPEAIVTLDPAFARAAADDPLWRRRRDGSRRRLLLLPEIPFGWIDRPPSVNRLLGCAWLADPEAAWMALARLSRSLYGLAPGEVPRPRWIP
ncbi:iron ABC transporter substrate-binding protein [Brevundimonas basaltis]|uniref:Iron complex transport system substrate-binding protein n=1 Tax=Brevundimonas basaltis TaxID=472166 RepID=A0A7W8I172_9CAUL|nr:iron ABC transporter substrate-binding protein [Brevundimonas basaltis]MBB5292690.1 iron complex transport system substrate-binding protein [Brevundimonas basaltis]